MWRKIQCIPFNTLWFGKFVVFPKKQKCFLHMINHTRCRAKSQHAILHFWVTWKLNCSIFAEVEMLMNDAYLHHEVITPAWVCGSSALLPFLRKHLNTLGELYTTITKKNGKLNLNDDIHNRGLTGELNYVGNHFDGSILPSMGCTDIGR